MIPLSKGFAPDAPYDEPNSITYATNIIPTQYGMKRAPARTILSAAVDSTFSQNTRGAKTLTKLDGSTRTFVAIVDTLGTYLYEYVSSTWTDRSPAAYTTGSDAQWSFAQFGDTSLAVDINNALQYSNTGAFAAVPGSPPSAHVLETMLTSGGGFALMFNTVDGTYGTSPDRWWCCALNDATSSTAWTPSIASQCATGRLLGYQGKINAARQLGSDRIIAYKEDSAYIGQYVGPPGVFSWQEFPGVGCVGKNAVVDLGGIHFVVGKDDIVLFDGVKAQSVSGGIREHIRGLMDDASWFAATAIYDKETDTVRVFASQGAAYALSKCFVYHVKRGIWGIDNNTHDFSPLLYPSSSAYVTNVVAAFDSDNKLVTFDGTPSGTTDITLPAIGDENYTTILKSVRVKFRTSPSAATAVVSKNASFGASQNSDFSQAAYDSPGGSYGIFWFRSTAKWHYVTLTLTGPFEILGYEYELEKVGRR